MGAGYTQLKVWQLSMDLLERIYRFNPGQTQV